MAGRFLDEPKLIALAYDLEQELGPRDIPKFLGSVPGPFADAGICAALATDAEADGSVSQASEPAHAGAARRSARARW